MDKHKELWQWVMEHATDPEMFSDWWHFFDDANLKSAQLELALKRIKELEDEVENLKTVVDGWRDADYTSFHG